MLPENREELQDKVVKPHSFEKVSRDKLETHFMSKSQICRNEKELANAILNDVDCIEIEGDLSKKVIRIKVTGKLAWAVCAVSLGTAIALYLITPEVTVATAPAGGAGGVISFTGGVAASAVAATSLGTATVAAISIGVAAGGIGAVNVLRDKYKIVEKRDDYLKLKRK